MLIHALRRYSGRDAVPRSLLHHLPIQGSRVEVNTKLLQLLSKLIPQCVQWRCGDRDNGVLAAHPGVFRQARQRLTNREDEARMSCAIFPLCTYLH